MRQEHTDAHDRHQRKLQRLFAMNREQYRALESDMRYQRRQGADIANFDARLCGGRDIQSPIAACWIARVKIRIAKGGGATEAELQGLRARHKLAAWGHNPSKPRNALEVWQYI